MYPWDQRRHVGTPKPNTTKARHYQYEKQQEFLHMQTFLRLAYMCHVTRIPLKVVPRDIIV